MTTTTKRARMLARIADHGRKVLALYPDAVNRHPVELCTKLRRIEREAHQIGLKLCNSPTYTYERADADEARILRKLADALGAGPPVFINRDPRGYALKIDDDYMREHNIDLARDWGGYGLIAPDLSDD